MVSVHKGLEDRRPLKTCGIRECMSQDSLQTKENSSLSLNRNEFQKGY